MANISITFEQVFGGYQVACEQLPPRHDAFIYEHTRAGKPSEWSLNTKTTAAYGRRRKVRRGRWFKTLDEAKAAAVAFVTKKVAAAERQTPKPHGCGEYFQATSGKYWAVRYPGVASLAYVPVGSKRDAKEWLETPPQWVLEKLAVKS